ncbi:MAG: gamma-glutamyltransferase [Oceanospirillales bacterium LUC14_002_19_P2]|nr:MAG: gamma-glutamyltransferase [Oceanospirillales bacterium LUC14_002_19_P2]
MRNRLAWLLSGCLLLQGASLQASPDVADAVAPEEGTGTTSQERIRASEFMVAAANPHAVEAGYEMLREGGSAVDAMIAAQLVLNLVEPQSSGIGGAFVVYYDSDAGKLTSWDGRETAPQAVTADLFLDEKGKPLSFYDAVVGGRSVATPGTLKLMRSLHERYGKLDWEVLFQPVIRLAQDGFRVSQRLAALIAKDEQRLRRYPVTATYFFPGGEALKEGDLLTNVIFANTLSLIAEKGIEPFYAGEIGRDIVAAVRSVTDNPGVLSREDLANYQIWEREPVCIEYRGDAVCGMGPPSSGGLTVGQILGMLEPFNLTELGAENPESWRLIGDASRLAFADRGHYMADADFVSMPEGLLDKDYLRQRSELLNSKRALTRIKPGTPPGKRNLERAEDESIELPSTTHLSIVDTEGNVVSMTSTIENAFGSRLMVRGFLLNNEMTDFSFRPSKDGKPVANRIEPGKRPRSSMAPTIVLRDNKPYLVVGSPGGSRIIGYVTKTLIAHLDWQMLIDEAIQLPHLINRFGSYDIEVGTTAEKLVAPLKAMGYQVNKRYLNSGLHGIVITEKGLEGAADARREGTVMGD